MASPETPAAIFWRLLAFRAANPGIDPAPGFGDGNLTTRATVRLARLVFESRDLARKTKARFHEQRRMVYCSLTSAVDVTLFNLAYSAGTHTAEIYAFFEQDPSNQDADDRRALRFWGQSAMPMLPPDAALSWRGHPDLPSLFALLAAVSAYSHIVLDRQAAGDQDASSSTIRALCEAWCTLGPNTRSVSLARPLHWPSRHAGPSSSTLSGGVPQFLLEPSPPTRSTSSHLLPVVEMVALEPPRRPVTAPPEAPRSHQGLAARARHQALQRRLAHKQLATGPALQLRAKLRKTSGLKTSGPRALPGLPHLERRNTRDPNPRGPALAKTCTPGRSDAHRAARTPARARPSPPPTAARALGRTHSSVFGPRWRRASGTAKPPHLLSAR